MNTLPAQMRPREMRGLHLCALVCPVKAIGKGEIVMKPGREGKPEDKHV